MFGAFAFAQPYFGEGYFGLELPPVPIPATPAALPLWRGVKGEGYGLGSGSVPAGTGGFKTVNPTGVAFGTASTPAGPGFQDVTPASSDEWRKRLS